MKRSISQKFFVFITSMSIIAPIFQMSVAHAATNTVSITCDGTGGSTAFSYGSPSQTVTVAQGDSLTISSLNSSYCDTLVLKDGPNPFNEGVNLNSPTAFTAITTPPPAGVVNLTVSATAAPGNYVLFIYQKYAGSSHPGIDWGEAIKVTVSSPLYPNSITGCIFTPSSQNLSYGIQGSISVSFSGTPSGSNELFMWQERKLDGVEITNSNSTKNNWDMSTSDVFPSTGWTFNYGSLNDVTFTKDYTGYYPGHTLVQNLYAFNSAGTGLVGLPLCTMTTTFGAAPTSANITYLAGAHGSGSAPSSPLTVANGSTFTTPVNTFIPATGYTFAGWSDGTSVYAENVTYPATGTVSGNVTLTATWRSLVTITSLSPIRGSIKGGDEVTITGTGFNNAASVTVGGVAARVMRRTGSTKITIRTPAHAKGAVSIVVTNPDNGFATYNSFTYVVGDERGDHR